MKRFLISSTLIVALGFAGIAQADGYRGHGHPPGIQKQLDRGKALPPGHQKKMLRAEHRRSYYDRHHDNRYRDNRHKHRYDRRDYGKKAPYYRYKPKYHDHRSGYRSSLGYNDRMPPEYRAARIIRDTQILIDQSRR